MPDNYYSEVNENGVVTPLRDLAAFSRSEQAVLGAKNILDPNKLSSGTLAYVPIYVGLNQTLTLSSTMPKNTSEGANLFLLAGNVQTGGSTANDGVWINNPRTVTSVDGYITVASRTDGGVNPHDYVSQLEYGSEATTIVPYAMTNKELTEKVQGIINAATNAADFAAFKTAIGNL